MKSTPRFRMAVLLMLWIALCLCLAACDRQTTPPTETKGTTAAATETPTEPATLPDETVTEAPSEATTVAETQPADPVLMTVVDMDGMEGMDVSDYFTRAAKCEISLEQDEEEGTVIRMATKSIGEAGVAKPLAYFKLGDLVEAMNGLFPKTTEYPHVVLKLKAHDLWSRNFSFFGGETLRDASGYEGYARTVRLANTADWQYIHLDLTPFTKDWRIFYLNFEQAAGQNGEAVDIAEVHFFATAEEAAALCPAMSDTYPVVEQSPEDYTLKVMSFNVQTENGTSVNFDLRSELLRDLLDELQPDSIGMQEVTTGWIYRMDTFAFNDSYAGVGEGRTQGGEASSIYYRKDKFDLVDAGTFWLSETPDKPGSFLEASLYPRICTWAHFRDKATGFEYIHLNTHLDHLGGSDGRALRTAQVRVILEFIQTLPDLPMVLTGDFNQAVTSSNDNVYTMFKNVIGQESFTTADGVEITGSFSDARADAADTVSPDAWASMTAYWQEGSSKYDPAHKPIDYVFYTPDHFDAMVYRNIHYHRDGIYMSDHLPQYCELHVTVATE